MIKIIVLERLRKIHHVKQSKSVTRRCSYVFNRTAIPKIIEKIPGSCSLWSYFTVKSSFSQTNLLKQDTNMCAFPGCLLNFVSKASFRRLLRDYVDRLLRQRKLTNFLMIAKEIDLTKNILLIRSSFKLRINNCLDDWSPYFPLI